MMTWMNSWSSGEYILMYSFSIMLNEWIDCLVVWREERSGWAVWRGKRGKEKIYFRHVFFTFFCFFFLLPFNPKRSLFLCWTNPSAFSSLLFIKKIWDYTLSSGDSNGRIFEWVFMIVIQKDCSLNKRLFFIFGFCSQGKKKKKKKKTWRILQKILNL